LFSELHGPELREQGLPPNLALGDRLAGDGQGRGNAGIAAHLALSESPVEKHVNTLFPKPGLSGDQAIHRWVAAVLTFLRDAGHRPPG
jgi:hypothetical protein